MEREKEERGGKRKKIYIEREDRFWIALYIWTMSGLASTLSIPHTLYFLFSDSSPKINLLQWVDLQMLSLRTSFKVFF